MTTLTIIPFREKEVKDYLDRCIIFWRKKKLNGDQKAEDYIDAYQSMRISLFGELLAP